MLLTTEPARPPAWIRVLSEKEAGMLREARLASQAAVRTGRKLYWSPATQAGREVSVVGRIGSPFAEGLSRQSLPVYTTDFCRHRVCIRECARGCSADILERGSGKSATAVLRDVTSALRDNRGWANAGPLGRARPGCGCCVPAACVGAHTVDLRARIRQGGTVYLRTGGGARGRSPSQSTEPAAGPSTGGLERPGRGTG